MNLFDHIKLDLARAKPREVVSVHIKTWCESGIQIAGFTHETPLKNLAAWAQHERLYFRENYEAGYIQLARLQ